MGSIENGVLDQGLNILGSGAASLDALEQSGLSSQEHSLAIEYYLLRVYLVCNKLYTEM